VIPSLPVLALFSLLPWTGASAPGLEPVTRICIAPAVVEANVGNTSALMDAVRETFMNVLSGAAIEVVPLASRLESHARAEAASNGCPYLLLTTVKHVRKGGGGMLGRMAGAAVHHGAIAAGASTGSVAGNVAGLAVAGAAGAAAANFATTVQVKDELTLEYRLEAGTKTVLNRKDRRKAESQGEDVLSPVVQSAAERIAASVLRP
jgi:hypothetical protein